MQAQGRRTLADGLKGKPEAHREVEEKFVFGGKAGEAAAPPEAAPVRPVSVVGRAPFTTRIRADLAHALKQASLKRQLEGVEPNTVQDILEQALEPWLRQHGYLS